MFWKSKASRERAGKYAELFCGAKFTKIVTINGAQVVFNVAPHTDPKRSLLSVNTYIAGTGLLTFCKTLDGNIESGVEKKIDYKKLASEAISDSKNIIDIKYSPDMISIVADLLRVGKSPDDIEAYVNSLLRRAVSHRGILIQPCSGYDASDLVALMSKESQGRILSQLTKTNNVVGVSQQATPPAPPASTSKPKLH